MTYIEALLIDLRDEANRNVEAALAHMPRAGQILHYEDLGIAYVYDPDRDGTSRWVLMDSPPPHTDSAILG